MNYNHLNKVHTYLQENILPNLLHQYTTISFDDYLKRFSFLPSGKWLREMDNVKCSRIMFAIDPEGFTKAYKKYCVTYDIPLKMDDGMYRIIYQVSPTLHLEIAVWVWVEHDVLNSYAIAFACYKDDKEYSDLVKSLWCFKREGNTEEKRRPRVS